MLGKYVKTLADDNLPQVSQQNLKNLHPFREKCVISYKYIISITFFCKNLISVYNLVQGLATFFSSMVGHISEI